MPRVCELCGKHTTLGRRIARHGIAKSKGGIGIKTTGVTRRSFKPNLQKIRVIDHGTVRRMRVCTACIRTGKIRKAP